MLYLGLTGNIASGKSEVAKMLAEWGATIIDADVLAREAVASGSAGLARIQARWGSQVLLEDGSLDRGALRRLVFEDKKELSELNAIVHPIVGALRDERLAEARERGDAVVVYVVPLLFENDLAGEFDSVILVDAPEPVRLRRLVHSRGLSETEAQAMIRAQMPSETKQAQADVVIENGGSREELLNRVTDVWRRLTASEGPSSLAV